MWCKSCRQDVPGIASLEEGAFHCARCGARVGRKRTSLADLSLTQDVCDQGIDLVGGPAEPSATDALHRWAEDEHLENVRRLLRPVSPGTAPTGMQPPAEMPRLRFDPPASHALRVPLPETAVHALARTSQYPMAANPSVVKTLPTSSANGGNSVASGAFTSLAWLIVSIGMMGLVCGGVLMGWSMATARLELWKLGLPTVIVGYAVLSLGLLLAYFAKRVVHHRMVRAATEQNLPYLAHANQSVATPTAGLPVGYALHAETTALPNPTPAMFAELRGQLDRLTAQSNATHSNRAW